ncbi:MAG: PadR family transcriptional regulator [Burkholderiales bacterium]|nr:PadR family transcriptional regulator [Anaerolineae bacterium]
MSHRYLVLGLLAERSMSGYDIKKRVKGALSTVTNASYGTLYPTLHRLLDEGAVEVQEVPQTGRPAKKLYQITKKGRQELREWLKQPAAADQIRREFLLKLYLAKNLPMQDLLTLVAIRRGETEALLRTLYAEQDDTSNSDPQQALVMDYALSLCKAEMDWLRQFEDRIQRV